MGYNLFFKKNTRLLSILVITAIFTFSLIIPLQADTPSIGLDLGEPKRNSEDQPDALLYLPGQLVVKFISDTVKSDVFGEIINGTVVDHLDNSEVYLYEVSRDANSYSLAEEVESMTQVVYAHPNYTINPLHPVQGSYPFSDDARTGDILTQASVGTLELAATQQYTTGNNVTVAVIDGGIDDTHTLLAGKTSTGYDYVDDDQYAFDELGGINSGHGTFVAGLVHLVAPDAEIKAYRITNPSGEGDGFTLAKAIEQAVLDGCDVINLSVVLTYEHFAVRDAIDFARSQNVSVIAAAGNTFRELPVYPAANDNTFAVTAVDSLNHLANFSSYGTHIDVCAPGTNIYSAYQDDGYAWWSGTSFAAPFVAGQVALLKELFPSEPVILLENVIRSSAVNIDNLNESYVGKIGNGLIDPLLSLNLMNSTDSLFADPDTLYFTMEEGAQYLVVLEETFALTSTNAPALYVGRITGIGGDEVFLIPEDSLYGYTDDSITVYLVDYNLPVGTYYNNIRFFAEDIIDPVDITVILTVTESTNPISASVTPDQMSFWAPVGAEYPMIGGAYLTSTNAPAAYAATVLPGGDQICYPADTMGITDDSVYVMVDCSRAPNPGFYYDSIACQVQGVNGPVYILVELEIRDTMPAEDTAWIGGDPWLYFTVTEGTEGTFTGCFPILSTNAPANYFVELLQPARFPIVMDSVGVTNDSVCFSFSAETLPVDIYNDTLLFYVDGVTNNPVMGIIVLNVTPDSGQVADSAWVIPEMLEFTHIYGAVPFTQVSEYVSVFSSNAPAEYSAVVVVDTESVFVTPYDTVYGTTNDSMLIYAYPYVLPIIDSPVFLPPGVYYNTMEFRVAGVENPVLLPIQLTVVEDSLSEVFVTVTPDQLYFTGVEGTYTVLSGQVFLNSNPQGIYSSGVTGYGFTEPEPDSAVGTPDTAVIYVFPSAVTDGPGLYYDTVAYYVQGIDGPALLQVTLEITPASGYDTAWVYPYAQGLESPYGVDSVYPGMLFIGSSNAPADYTIYIKDSPDIVQLIDTSGITDDSIFFDIVATAGMAPGVYVDTLMVEVNGVMNNPKMALVYLHIDTLPGSDTAWVYPYAQYYLANPGENLTQTGAVFVGSDNAPALFTVEIQDYPDFIRLIDTVSYTGDSFYFDVVSTSDMPPGVYIDTLKFFVDGVHNNPYRSIVYLFIDTATGNGTAWVSPYAQGYESPYGEDSVHIGALFISSSNAPADYTIYIKDNPDVVQLYDTSGITEDSIFFDIVATSSMVPGVYVDTLMIEVTGVTNNPQMALVYLYIDTLGGTDTAWVYPRYQYFMANEGEDLTQTGVVDIGSDNAPALFTVETDSYRDFIRLTDTVGYTGDSFYFDVISVSSMPAGVYVDTLVFFVEGVHNNPYRSIVYLFIDSVSGNEDSIWVEPYSRYYGSELGEDLVMYNSVFIGSTDSSLNYFIEFLDTPDITVLVDSAGVVNDSANYEVHATASMPVGTYSDTLLIHFDDLDNTTLISIVNLIIYENNEPDTVYLEPGEIWITLPYGSTTPVTRTVYLSSSNAPANFIGMVAGDDFGCVSLQDSVGYTDDTVMIVFDPTDLMPGMDTANVVFYVEGIDDPKYLIIFVTVDDPAKVAYLQNYPNPFNPETNIEFSLMEASRIKLEIFNILGQQVITLVDDNLTAGTHIYTWNGKDNKGQKVSSGIYFYRLQTDRTSITKKMLLLK